MEEIVTIEDQEEGERNRISVSNMTAICSIEGCLSKSTSIKVKDIIYYLFPSDDAWAETWNRRILENDPSFEREPKSLVCSLHFTKSSMHPSSRMLIDHAVPTIFPKVPNSTGNRASIVAQQILNAAKNVEESQNRVRCCINECRTVFDGSTAVPGFPFPQNVARRKLWLYLIKLKNNQDLDLNDRHRLCGLHFMATDFIKDSKTLNELAKPTIFGAALKQRAIEFKQQEGRANGEYPRLGRPKNGAHPAKAKYPIQISTAPNLTQQAIANPSHQATATNFTRPVTTTNPTRTVTTTHLPRPLTTQESTLMPPPQPIRRSLPPSVRNQILAAAQSPISKTGASIQDRSQQQPACVITRRMSTPHGRMPTLRPKPTFIIPPANVNNAINPRPPSLQPKQNLILVSSHSSTSSISTPNAVVQSRPMPKLTAAPSHLARTNGQAVSGGQSLLLHTPNQSTPVIHSVQSGTSPAIVIGQPNSLFTAPSHNISVGRPIIRRYSVAARPTESLQSAANGHIQMNGTNLLRRIAADATMAMCDKSAKQVVDDKRGANTVKSIIQTSSPHQSPTDKVKIIESPYVITSQDALDFPRMLMNRIVRSQRRITEFSSQALALKRKFNEMAREKATNNKQLQIVETIDISCD